MKCVAIYVKILVYVNKYLHKYLPVSSDEGTVPEMAVSSQNRGTRCRQVKSTLY
jgi:hypothetical protein